MKEADCLTVFTSSIVSSAVQLTLNCKEFTDNFVTKDEKAMEMCDKLCDMYVKQNAPDYLNNLREQTYLCYQKLKEDIIREITDNIKTELKEEILCEISVNLNLLKSMNQTPSSTPKLSRFDFGDESANKNLKDLQKDPLFQKVNLSLNRYKNNEPMYTLEDYDILKKSETECASPLEFYDDNDINPDCADIVDSEINKLTLL